MCCNWSNVIPSFSVDRACMLVDRSRFWHLCRECRVCQEIYTPVSASRKCSQHLRMLVARKVSGWPQPPNQYGLQSQPKSLPEHVGWYVSCCSASIYCCCLVFAWSRRRHVRSHVPTSGSGQTAVPHQPSPGAVNFQSMLQVIWPGYSRQCCQTILAYI